MKPIFKNFLFYFTVTVVFLNSCKKDEVKALLPVTISPSVSSIDEGFKRKVIKIKFSSPVDQADSLQVLINGSATYGQDFTTTPASKNSVISLFAAKGDTTASFQISANLDGNVDPNETVSFSLKKLPSGFEPDKTNGTAAVTILDNTLYNGLIGEYLFDGNATDTSPSQNSGTVHEAVVGADHLNSGNYAYTFNGVNNYIGIPSTDALNFPNKSDFTVSVWASAAFPQASPANGNFDVVRKWAGDAQGSPFAIVFSNDQAGANQNTMAGGRSDGSACAHTPTVYSSPINSAGYHHIVEVKSGSVLQLFIDGNKVAETPDTATCGETSTTQVTVGCRGQLARFFKGSIDDLRFYKRALTPDEIKILFRI